jgi:hypothetical protein
MKKIFAAIVTIALGSPAQALATEYQPGELYLIPRNVPMCETNEGEDCTEDKTSHLCHPIMECKQRMVSDDSLGTRS